MITSQSFQDAMSANVEINITREQAESLAGLIQDTIRAFPPTSPAWKRWLKILESIKEQHPEVIPTSYQGD